MQTQERVFPWFNSPAWTARVKRDITASSRNTSRADLPITVELEKTYNIETVLCNPHGHLWSGVTPQTWWRIGFLAVTKDEAGRNYVFNVLCVMLLRIHRCAQIELSILHQHRCEATQCKGPDSLPLSSRSDLEIPCTPPWRHSDQPFKCLCACVSMFLR